MILEYIRTPSPTQYSLKEAARAVVLSAFPAWGPCIQQESLDILVEIFLSWGVMSNVVIQAALIPKKKRNDNMTVCSPWFNVAEGLILLQQVTYTCAM